MQKGTKFEIRIPAKFRQVLRCLHLRNPFYAEGARQVADLAPWRRLGLLFSPPGNNPTPFLEYDPFPALATHFDVPVSEPLDELAAAVAEGLTHLNRNVSPKEIRQRMFVVNDMHHDAMESNFGEPNLEKYQGHPVVEAYAKNGSVVKVAVIEPHRLYRKGQTRLGAYQGDTELHPLAESLAEALFGRMTNVRFDHIETGPWGVRVGILGWNCRASNLGFLLAEIFSAYPELYKDYKTAVFTDQYGRACTFYGWPLSSDELAAPDIMCRLLELIGVTGHQEQQILRANKDVLLFLQEMGVKYRTSNHSLLSALFFGFMYLTPGEFQSVVGALRTRHDKAEATADAARLVCRYAKAAGLGELCQQVFRHIGGYFTTISEEMFDGSENQRKDN